MRGFILGLSLSIAFVLGCVTAPVIAPAASAQEVRPLSAEQRAAGPALWEYTCHSNVDEFANRSDYARVKLNRYGREGWELIGFMPRVGFCFKRPR